ncbi:hypothetical protein [Endozoicomonas sp.]|uniref:hypothetical protein n=1 Tax=Endozoicomonas sp. TaxID=1892382 RepID=UPI002885CC80|nr:hypothetical protein [Endozoicomonas sp.]
MATPITSTTQNTGHLPAQTGSNPKTSDGNIKNSSPIARQTQSSTAEDRSEFPPLKKRIACIFKTGGNYFARTFLSTAIAINTAGVLIGGLLGACAGVAITAPLAGVVKLVEILTRKNTGYGQAILNNGACLGFLVTGFLTGQISGGLGVIAGLGLGLAAGGIGLVRGAYDGMKGDVSRLSQEGKTLSDFLHSIPDPKHFYSRHLSNQAFGQVRQEVVATSRVLQHFVWG